MPPCLDAPSCYRRKRTNLTCSRNSSASSSCFWSSTKRTNMRGNSQPRTGPLWWEYTEILSLLWHRRKPCPACGQPGHGKLFHVRRSWMSCCHSKCKSNYHAHLAATHVLAGQSATRVGRDAWSCWTPVQPAHRVRHVPRSANENYRRVFALTREYSESNGHSRKQQVWSQRSDLALQNGMRHVVDDLRWRVSGGLRKCQHWSYSVELVLDK